MGHRHHRTGPPPAFAAAQRLERQRRAATASSTAAVLSRSRLDDTFAAADSVRMMEMFPQSPAAPTGAQSARLPALLPAASSQHRDQTTVAATPSAMTVAEHNAAIRELTQRMMMRFHERLAVQAAVARGQMPAAALEGFSLLRSADGSVGGRMTSASRGPPDTASRLAGASSRASVGPRATADADSRLKAPNAMESASAGKQAASHTIQTESQRMEGGADLAGSRRESVADVSTRRAVFADEFTVELAMRAEEEVTALAGFRLSRGGARDRATAQRQHTGGSTSGVPLTSDPSAAVRLPPILKSSAVAPVPSADQPPLAAMSRRTAVCAVGSPLSAPAPPHRFAHASSPIIQPAPPSAGNPHSTTTAPSRPPPLASAAVGPAEDGAVSDLTSPLTPELGHIPGARRHTVVPADASYRPSAASPTDQHRPATDTPTAGSTKPLPDVLAASAPIGRAASPQAPPTAAVASPIVSPRRQGNGRDDPTVSAMSTSMPTASIAENSFYGEKALPVPPGKPSAAAASVDRPPAVPVTPSSIPAAMASTSMASLPSPLTSPAQQAEAARAGDAGDTRVATADLVLPVAVQRSHAARARLADMRDKVGALTKLSRLGGGGGAGGSGTASPAGGATGLLEQRHIDALRSQQEALEAILQRAAGIIAPAADADAKKKAAEAAAAEAAAKNDGKKRRGKPASFAAAKRGKSSRPQSQGDAKGDAGDGDDDDGPQVDELRAAVLENIRRTLDRTKAASHARDDDEPKKAAKAAPKKAKKRVPAAVKSAGEKTPAKSTPPLRVVGESAPSAPVAASDSKEGTPVVPVLRLTTDDADVPPPAVPTPPPARPALRRDRMEDSMRFAALGGTGGGQSPSARSPAATPRNGDLTPSFRRSPQLRNAGGPSRGFTMRRWEPTKPKAEITDLSELVAEQEAADVDEVGAAQPGRRRAVHLPEERRVVRVLEKLAMFRKQATERDAAAKALLEAQVAEVIDAGAMSKSVAMEEAQDEELLPELPKEVAKRQRYREKLAVLEAELEAVSEECRVLRTGTGESELTRDSIVRRWVEAGMADDGSDDSDEDDDGRTPRPDDIKPDDELETPRGGRKPKAKKDNAANSVFGAGGFAEFVRELEEAAVLHDFTAISSTSVGVQVDPPKPKRNDLPNEPNMDPNDPMSAPNQVINALYRNEQALYRTLANLSIAVANVAEFFSSLEVDLTCRACLTTLSQPRSLQGCGHCFCAECVNGMYIGLEAIQCAECTHVSHAGCIPNPTVESIVSQWNARGAGREDTILYELGTLRDAINDAETEVMSAYGAVHDAASRSPGAPRGRRPRLGGKSLQGATDAFDLTNVRDVIIHARVIVDDL